MGNTNNKLYSGGMVGVKAIIENGANQNIYLDYKFLCLYSTFDENLIYELYEKNNWYKQKINNIWDYFNNVYKIIYGSELNEYQKKSFLEFFIREKKILANLLTINYNEMNINNYDVYSNYNLGHYIKENLDNFSNFDTITIAYGAGSQYSQILPYTDEFINENDNKRNLILSFDNFDESGFGSFDDYNFNNLKNYITTKTKYKFISNTNEEYKYITDYDKIINEYYSEIMGGENQTINKLCAILSEKCNEEAYNNLNNKIKDLIHQKINESKNIKDLLFEKIFKINCKEDESKNQETKYELHVIKSNLYLTHIQEIINTFKSKSINIICSIRKVDCICNFLNLKNLLTDINNLYIAHGNINEGYIVNFTGKYLNNSINDFKKILNDKKTGLDIEFEEELKKNTKEQY